MLANLVVMLTAEHSAKFTKMAALTLILAKIVVINLVISYYDHAKIYSTWSMLAVKGGSTLAVYAISKFIKTE